MTKIIKEYCKQETGFRFILRLPHYGHTLQHINQLFEEAQRDFKKILEVSGLSGLPDSQVEIVQYGGECYKYTFGIEFNLDCTVPEGYERVEQVKSDKIGLIKALRIAEPGIGLKDAKDEIEQLFVFSPDQPEQPEVKR